MLKEEFEKIAGYKVSAQDYYGIIEPMYYATTESKADFVKSINRRKFEQKETPKYKRVLVGVKPMPNGTWMTYEAEILDVNIKTGKTIVRRLSNNRCWAETWFDIWSGLVTEA